MEDEEETTNLAARVLKLKEQIQGMYQQVGELTGSSEVSKGEGSVGWTREAAVDEWQRWNGARWITIEQQNLNSRRRKISVRLRRMITREQNGMTNLVRELRSDFKHVDTHCIGEGIRLTLQ